MKKFFVSILAFLYLTSSCEATVYLHYCMGKQVSFSFFPDQASHCHTCGMKKSAKGMGCCKDEQKLVKSDKSQKLTDLSAAPDLQKKFFSVVSSFRAYTVDFSDPLLLSYSPSHGPPGYKPVPFYLMHRLLLI